MGGVRGGEGGEVRSEKVKKELGDDKHKGLRRQGERVKGREWGRTET